MEKPESQAQELVKLAFFVEIGKAITAARNIEETLKEIMVQIGTIFAPKNWSLLLRNPRSGDLKFIIATGSGVEGLRGRIIPRGKGIAGWISESGQPVIIDDVSRDKRFDPEMDELVKFQTKSIIGVPLKTRNRVLGVIELVNKLDDQMFTSLDLKILMSIADFAAIAIEKNYYLQALRKLSQVDSLTGLANRRSFEKTLEREKERTRRSQKQFCVLVMDINDFKTINDTHGHVSGDLVLKNLAIILQRTLRQMDLAARLGGDEFAVILPETTRRGGEEVRDRILKTLEGFNKGSGIPFTISIGVESADPQNPDLVFEKADRDMYSQKYSKLEQNIEEIPDNLEEFLVEERLEGG